MKEGCTYYNPTVHFSSILYVLYVNIFSILYCEYTRNPLFFCQINIFLPNDSYYMLEIL